MSLALHAITVASQPAALLNALNDRRESLRRNDVIPVIIVVAIVVLLVLAVTVVAGAIILCSIHGAVFDTVASIKGGSVTVKCHKL